MENLQVRNTAAAVLEPTAARENGVLGPKVGGSSAVLRAAVAVSNRSETENHFFP